MLLYVLLTPLLHYMLDLPTLSHYQEVIRLAKEQAWITRFLIELLTREVTNHSRIN